MKCVLILYKYEVMVYRFLDLESHQNYKVRILYQNQTLIQTHFRLMMVDLTLTLPYVWRNSK